MPPNKRRRLTDGSASNTSTLDEDTEAEESSESEDDRRRSVRIRKTQDRAKQFPIISSHGKWGPALEGSGSWMKAIFTSTGIVPGRNTRTDLPLVKKVSELLGLKNGKLVAGHLLNADLGGDGMEKRNLTLLTHSANGLHETIESRVKSWVELLPRLLKENQDTLNLNGFCDFAVTYKVTVDVQRMLTDQGNLLPEFKSIDHLDGGDKNRLRNLLRGVSAGITVEYALGRLNPKGEFRELKKQAALNLHYSGLTPETIGRLRVSDSKYFKNEPADFVP